MGGFMPARFGAANVAAAADVDAALPLRGALRVDADAACRAAPPLAPDTPCDLPISAAGRAARRERHLVREPLPRRHQDGTLLPAVRGRPQEALGREDAQTRHQARSHLQSGARPR